ncbi:MAG: hypothetical protein KGJ23_01995 [Euryarchaeota archaeon]|nr:hypothetical protein [Euryarchaeota archaeon]MDE1835367.1 hypothetical protein [Euryarchaeota archaeon]MDE1880470.1 hypothetical protein [Euryarchaeota archaeon]MDE2043663.1 hypothetical protein [Thermoplasmata archaeon]
MPRATLVIINESPSLGAGLTDLFEAEGYRVCCARDLSEARPLVSRSRGQETMLLVVASNGHYSPAVQGWINGSLSDLPLVVVGSRDAHLRSHGMLRVIHLPLNVPRFLEEIFDLTNVVVNQPIGA